jgi:hypothetical protein
LAPKKKVKKPTNAKNADEEEKEVRPKGDPFYWGQLNDFVRSERFETRIEHM